ncbi:lectin family glycoprotein receptor [Schizosaccharomyces japonicus yFS275]|uniref:Lectin family glycoprotein receptor n=1 Tax=Schizosaccharomyces japonicus (strain yFS275 / FY16936) TaxID=402676 RepID=B6JZF3_SCHJY|nr:lectin family glycoprotein receptor [Schizosaccharomyces japonicus yFS275]EEB06921.1 lectin family glycoprotein receptor [Schizosaccharomyces japonicus yFS275]
MNPVALFSIIFYAFSSLFKLSYAQPGTRKLSSMTLEKPYIDHGMRNLWWEYGGNTVVDRKNGVLLTQDLSEQHGWISSRLPAPARSFVIDFEVKIHGLGTTVYGDGMGIFLTEERAKTGPVFGFADEFTGYGIFIDTYNNNRPRTAFPYVMAMKGDGKTKYDVENDGKANEIGGCSARRFRNSRVATKGRITYRKDLKKLSLDLAYLEKDVYVSCFELEDVELPQTTFLSFSAHTGEVSDYHEVISVVTHELTDENKDAAASPAANSQPVVDTPINNAPKVKGSSWKKPVILVLFFLILVFGFMAYRSYTQQRMRRTSVL